MAVRVVQLGSDRLPDEGLRIGTVRRPPRGVPKSQFASRNYYDVWLPTLSPSPATLKLGQGATTEQQWTAFARKDRAEMAKTDASALLNVLAALSHNASFSVGCYCENESHCHRSVLRELLRERGANLK